MWRVKGCRERKKRRSGELRIEAEEDSIPAALDELGEDEYSEEEIRLMRIKFMSEMGN